jgi:hypothetical protein
MATLLLERLVFLEKEVIPINATQLKPLADPLTGRYPACTLCGKATLRPSLDIPKAEDGPSEVAVKLPCSHVFGQTCIKSHFKKLRPEDQLYQDRCPQCNVLLFTQSTVAARYDEASETNEQIVFSYFGLLAVAMFTLCVVAVSSSAFAWEWIFLFCPLGFMCIAGIDMFKKHAEIRKQLVDLEKGRNGEVSTTEQIAFAQTRRCDAEASTVAEAALAKDCATDQPKISCSDDDITIVEHNEDEERARLLSNTA